MASNGVIYCMPNNHKAVLQIVPPCLPSREWLHKARDERESEREARREAAERERWRESERKRAEREERRERRILEKRGGKGGRRNDVGGTGSSEEEKKAEDTANREVRPTLTDRPSPNDGTTEESNLEAMRSAMEGGKTTEDATDRSGAQYGGSSPDFKYRSGIPTLRSSSHRVKYSPTHRQLMPDPKGAGGNFTNTTFLPELLLDEDVSIYSTSEYDFHGAVVGILRRCDETLVGSFRTLSDGTSIIPKLDNFFVPPTSLVRECQRGKLERAQEYLSDAVTADADFLRLFDGFVVDEILPRLKARLRSAGSHEGDDTPVTFFYQRPPTLRIQPGPARASVRAHNDAEYGRELPRCPLIFSLELSMHAKNSNYRAYYFHASPVSRSKWRTEFLAPAD